MKTALFVPAKGHSERIPSKNLTILDGEYLFKRKLIQMLECQEVDEVWLDSESDLIHDLARDLPIHHMYRDPSLASNKTDGHEMFANEVRQTDADIVVQVLCTAPFIDADVIDNALKELKASNKTSLVGVFLDKFYEWENGKPAYGDHIPNSVDLPVRTLEAMSLYAVKTGGKPVQKRYSDEAILYRLPPLQSVDINNKEDLELAQNICAGIRSKKNQQLHVLSKSLTSSLLSDICKELGIKHFLSHRIKPLTHGSFLGYAKTLKIKALEDEQKNPGKKDWEAFLVH